MSYDWSLYRLYQDDVCSRCGEHSENGYIDDMGEVIICENCAEWMEQQAIDAKIDELIEG